MNIFSAKHLTLLSALVLSFAVPESAEANSKRKRQNQEQGPLLAQADGKANKKRRRKRNRRRKMQRQKQQEMQAAENAKPNTHAAQEGSVEPYKWELGLTSDLSRTTSKQGDAETGYGSYNLNLKALYLVSNSFEVGGQLAYDETTTKVEDSESGSSSYMLHLLGKYNFGNLDEDTFLFFVYGGFGFGNATTKAGDTESSVSRSGYRLGLGSHYFVDSNVALTTQIDMESNSEKPEEGDAVESTRLHLLQIGFSLFL
jgi:hypothetical protein